MSPFLVCLKGTGSDVCSGGEGGGGGSGELGGILLEMSVCPQDKWPEFSLVLSMTGGHGQVPVSLSFPPLSHGDSSSSLWMWQGFHVEVECSWSLT